MRRWIVLLLVISVSLMGALTAYSVYERSAPVRWTAGNLLPNADWSLPAEPGTEPDGWVVSGDVKRVNADQGYVLEQPYALRLRGSNSFARSPALKVTPGQSYRIGFQALLDPGTAQGSIPARVAVWVHWIDAAGDVIKLDKLAPHVVGYAADGTPVWTPILLETAPAPANAVSMAISFHALTDEVLLLDNLSLNAAGIYIDPWPHGAQAAVSFSVDWETAMGGYIHTRASDPYTPAQATAIGLRSRAGTEQLLRLFQTYDVQGTWFANGYNLLDGNPEQRTWMGDPTFEWASPEQRWLADWSTRPWFADDPYGSLEDHPGWYFGDLTRKLQAADQAIESHTFSHLYVGLATLEQWRSDLQAWNELAATLDLGPATALAFPWGSSGGMTDGHWQALEAAGITTVVRTHLPADRSATTDPLLLINRRAYQARLLPGRNMLVLPDFLLLPTTQLAAQQALTETVAVGGVIDFWAHTSEIVDPEQVATWDSFVRTATQHPDIWVASVPQIAAYWRGIRLVGADILGGTGYGDDPLTVQIANPNSYALDHVSLRLPGSIDHTQGAAVVAAHADQLIVNLAPYATTEIQVWLES